MQKKNWIYGTLFLMVAKRTAMVFTALAITGIMFPSIYGRQDENELPDGIVYPPAINWSRDGMWAYQKVITLGAIKDTNLRVPGAVEFDSYQQDLGNGIETFVIYRWRGSHYQESKSNLDFYCDAQNRGFFMLNTPWGVGYTRDGRFRRDDDNRLVSLAGKYPVIGYEGDIYVPEGHVVVIPNGTMYVDGDRVGRIKVAIFKDRITLWTINGSVFFNDGTPDLLLGDQYYKIRQGFVENSNTVKGLKGDKDSAKKGFEASARSTKVNLKTMKSAIRVAE